MPDNRAVISPRQRLTPRENVNIITRLLTVEAKEKKLARQVVGLQAIVILIVAAVVYGFSGAQQYAIATLVGGVVSLLNGVLLAWRMSRMPLNSAHDTHHSGEAHRQLRLMYFYAAERFLAVAVLFSLCMAVMKIPPLAVLGGFVVGQVALISARLLLNKLN